MIIAVSEREILSNPNDQELGRMVRHRYLEAKMDRCVECGGLTPYHVSDHVDTRVGYVEGAGQGCWKPHVCKSRP